MNIQGYDAWRLSTPYDDFDGVGTEDGEMCNRIAEPDEDAPRGYRPKPCKGTMAHVVSFDDRHVACDTCGEIA